MIESIVGKFYKKIIKNHIVFCVVIFIASIFVYLYMRFVILTSKINYDIKVDKSNLKKNNYIIVSWHGRVFLLSIVRKFFSNICVLVSSNKVAYLSRLVIRYFFGKTIKMSKDINTSSNIRSVLSALKQKKTMFLIPDGSIGPLMTCNSGVDVISLLSKKSILPISFSAKKGVILNSWDRFFIPFPFNDITVCIGEPINPYYDNNEKKTKKYLRNAVENALNNQTWKLDSKYGRKKINKGVYDKKGRIPIIKD